MVIARNLPRPFTGGQRYTTEGMLLEIPPSGFNWRAVHGLEDQINPYSENVAQQYPLGTKLIYGEEVYRYFRNGGVATELAALNQAVVPLAGEIDEAIDISAIGDKTISFTTSGTITLAANELQDGYIFIYSGTGLGHKYKVLSHPAAASADAAVVLTLVDPVIVATVAASKATVIHNKFFKTVIHVGFPTAIPVGWSQVAHTANYYGWLQTKGPITAQIDGVVKMGQLVRPSEDDDGAVALLTYDETTSANNSDAGPVGHCLEIGADGAGSLATLGFVQAELE